jgi:3alpha(or 20beta)-hydroxysteroid dehydrogenase
MQSLKGKVAVITGAARGQGEAEARLLAQHGAKVVLTDVLADQGVAAAATIGTDAVFVEHDVSTESGWQRVVETALAQFGRIDVLVNNAAISRPLRLEATEPELFDLLCRVNQRGVYLGMRAVIEPMRNVGGGSIINISSVAGLQGTAGLFAYTSTKWAVRGMSRSAALELARYGIRVNCIFPGVIDTPINDANPAHMNEMLVKTTPMRRMGKPREIAEAVLFLATDASSFATGGEFAIDGGMSI